MTLWPKVIISLLVVGLGAGAVLTYRAAVSDAARLKVELFDLNVRLGERDTALAEWAVRRAEWDAERKAGELELSKKEAERAAAAKRLAITLAKYNDEIRKLPLDDLVCASRPVPAAVDRLLAGENQAAAAR